jgi:hypothetical protein
VKEKELLYSEVMKLVLKFEQENNLYINLNNDCGIFNVILMNNEWEVNGAYAFFEKPVTKSKVLKALEETLKIAREMEI